MAKKVLTPEEKAAQEAAKKAAQEAESRKQKAEVEENVNEEMQKTSVAEGGALDAKIKSAFEHFPTADKLYIDGEELFFSQVKPNMTVVKRGEYINKTDK